MPIYEIRFIDTDECEKYYSLEYAKNCHLVLERENFENGTASIGKKHWLTQFYSLREEYAVIDAPLSASIMSAPFSMMSRGNFAMMVDVDVKDIFYFSMKDCYATYYHPSNGSESFSASSDLMNLYHKNNDHEKPYVPDKMEFMQWIKNSNLATTHNFSLDPKEFKNMLLMHQTNEYENGIYNEAMIRYNGNKNPISIILPRFTHEIDQSYHLKVASVLCDLFALNGNQTSVLGFNDENHVAVPAESAFTNLTNDAVAKKDSITSEEEGWWNKNVRSHSLQNSRATRLSCNENIVSSL